jgi:hypothetical protein
MTALNQFIDFPWKKGSLHEKYVNSFIHLTPAVEVATGEVLLASLYRKVGFNDDISENNVPIYGRKFVKNLDQKKRPSKGVSAIDLDDDIWLNIVKKSLTSPKQTNQSKKQFLQLSPLVPDSTIYSMSSRLSSGSWNAGKLIAKMISLGTESNQHSIDIWQLLYEKLSIHDESDDVWSRLIQKELETWREKELLSAWKKPSDLPLTQEEKLHQVQLETPAKSFVKDLETVLSLKETLTRRQWTSLIESLCRVASSAHVMWLCKINKSCTAMFENALKNGAYPTESEVTRQLSLDKAFWALDQPTTKTIEDTVRGYTQGRCAINLILWMTFENENFDFSEIDLMTPTGVFQTLEYLANNHTNFNYKEYKRSLSDILENDPRVTACKKGSSKNILEFLTHVTRQRQTSEAGLESYDQGYFSRKRRNRWVVGLGPASLLLMVHCTTTLTNGPCTIGDLVEHLSKYGLEADFHQNNSNYFYKLLRSLGLVIDSPDAEGGMIIISPLHSPNS